jgi:lipopolysaccharide biosynthesis regulator YciM
MVDNKRFIEMVTYLRQNKYVRNQQDFTERINSDKSTVSQIMNNRIAIPNNMFGNVVSAFPFISKDWLLYGEGEMLRSTYTQNIDEGQNFTQTGNVTVNNSDAALLKAIDEISEQRKMVQKAQEQIDRLIALLEHQKC